jgi:hypothetical protein
MTGALLASLALAIGSRVDSADLAPTPAPVGGAFRVNTYTTGQQRFPKIAQDASGNFVVGWRRAYAAVAVQRYNAAGAPLGAEIFIPESQQYLSPHLNGIASDPFGNFVVVWDQNREPLAGVTDVYAQRFASSGTPIGGFFRVNSYTTNTQRYPSIASTVSGGFVVVWQQGIGVVNQVLARRFASSGAPLGAEFRVNTTTGDKIFPIVAGNGTGGFVVVWQDPSAGNDSLFYAQRFSSSGSPAGGEIPLNSLAGGRQEGAAVAVDASGAFLVAWSSENVDGHETAIVARRYSSIGTPLAPQFRVNSDTTGRQQRPSVSFESSGRFVVAWQSGAGFNAYGVFGRLYDKTGAPLGTEFRISTATTSSQHAAVVFGKPWVTVWDENNVGSGGEIFGQILTPCRSSDQDGNGQINVSDVFYLINHLFAGGPAPLCGGDANGDGFLNVTDVFYLINFLFAGGPAPI